MAEDPSKLLENAQQERFAQLVASGINPSEAYRKLSPECTDESSWTLAWKLLRKIDGEINVVRARIEWLQQQSASAATMTMKERREFCARAKRIKLHSLDLETDGDLVQEIDYFPGEQGGGVRKMKLPGKLDCVMADAKLSGELIEKQEVVQKGDPDAPIVVQLPAICYTPRKRKGA